MAAVTTATVVKIGVRVVYSWIRDKYPGGIWGFLGSIFLLGVIIFMVIASMIQALLAGIPNWDEFCSAEGSDSSTVLPAGDLIFPMAKGTATPTSPYGPRWGRTHRGQDWGAPHGTPMYSIAAGKVLFAGPASGFGQSIWIEHNINGETWTSQYGHMPSATKYIKTGQEVKAGQRIADIGSEGFSTGPHLHFQIHKGATKTGNTQDPMKWLKDRGAKEINPPGKNATIRNTSILSGTTEFIAPFISTAIHNLWLNNGYITNVGVISKYDKLSAEQKENSKIIISVGKEMGFNSWGWTVALGVAMQESQLININYGDRDSLGLFQQRPSQGWGTRAQITDPRYASKKFYEGLKKIKGWENMPLTVAGQAVQRSGYPNAYAKWEPLAKDIVLALEDEVVAGHGSNGGGGMDCSNGSTSGIPMGECVDQASPAIENVMRASGPGYKAAQPDTLRVARCVYGTFQSRGIKSILGPGQRPNKSDHTEGKAADVMIPNWNKSEGNQLGNDVALFVQKNHKELGVTYIIWDVKIWHVNRDDPNLPLDKWRPYTHPNGNANPTVRHEDHVHVSVHGNKGTGINKPIDEAATDTTEKQGVE